MMSSPPGLPYESPTILTRTSVTLVGVANASDQRLQDDLVSAIQVVARDLDFPAVTICNLNYSGGHTKLWR